VGAGERQVGTGEGTLSVLGLGSCVVIVLWDEATRIGGLAHVLLPDPSLSPNRQRIWRFATTAIPSLVAELVAAGAERARLTARLIGGACMFLDLLPKDQPNIGERNIAAARETLAETGVRIVGEAVGGDFGRSIHFHLNNGRVLVTSHRSEDVEI
jgi:chemotaxis protein CheD